MGVTNPFDPTQNALGGAKYLAQQLNNFGQDVRLALAAYNAGPGAARVAVNNYPETMAYIERVLRFAGQFGFGGFRAQGGPISPNTAYIAGERGRELIMSDRRGQVVSASDLEAIIRGLRDGTLNQPAAAGPSNIVFDTKVQTNSRDPELTAALVEQRLADRIGGLSR